MTDSLHIIMLNRVIGGYELDHPTYLNYIFGQDCFKILPIFRTIMQYAVDMHPTKLLVRLFVSGK